eukprot:TRINITY_DN5799_c0_g1_i2.p1 TRINITY_DN5799_c0_g1~~TRINITY_DN5799_c0_g1_i2.p1  ORF type:complete len:319 (-),score=146.56 TRINITY_DN5799_c0_g1_i2:106-945(-)
MEEASVEELQALQPELVKVLQSLDKRLAGGEMACLPSPQKRRRLIGKAGETKAAANKQECEDSDGDDEVDGHLAALMRTAEEEAKEEDEQMDEEEEEEVVEEDEEEEEAEEEEAEGKDDMKQDEKEESSPCKGDGTTGEEPMKQAADSPMPKAPVEADEEEEGKEEEEEAEDTTVFVGRGCFMALKEKLAKGKAPTQKQLLQAFDEESLPEGEDLLALETSAVIGWPSSTPAMAAVKQLIAQLGIKEAAQRIVKAGEEALSAEEEGEEEEELEDDPEVK